MVGELVLIFPTATPGRDIPIASPREGSLLIKAAADKVIDLASRAWRIDNVGRGAKV
jgi:hypothetical protein